MSLRFLGVLLRAPSTAQRLFAARQIPEVVFREDARYVRWVLEYQRQNGRYPTPAAFKQRFPGVGLPKAPRESVESVLQPILDHDAFTRMSEIVSDAKRALDAGEPVGTIVNAFRGRAEALPHWSAAYDDAYFRDGDLVYNTYKQRVASAEAGDSYSQPTPWPTLNEIMGYMDAGEMTTLAARLSIGKTWLVINWANYLDLRGDRVLLVSKEMTTAQIMMRFEALRFKLPFTQLRNGTLPAADLGRWRRQRFEFTRKDKSELLVSGNETFHGIGFEQIMQHVERHQPSTVIIDGAYLLAMPGRFSSGTEKFQAISNQCKRLAKSARVRLIITVQGNRNNEDETGNSRMAVRDVYGSDAWAQDSDFLIGIAGRRGSNAGRVLDVLKGRDTGLGQVAVVFKQHPYPDFSEDTAQTTVAKLNGMFTTDAPPEKET